VGSRINTNNKKEEVRIPLYIMYFNLKDSVSEEEFVNKSKEWINYVEGKIEGAKTESTRLYRHHFFGANKSVYQMHFEFEGFSTWDEFIDLAEKDAECARLLEEWQNLFDFNTHYDEFVREIPL